MIVLDNNEFYTINRRRRYDICLTFWNYMNIRIISNADRVVGKREPGRQTTFFYNHYWEKAA